VGPWSTAKRLFQEFQRDNGMLLAAAVAFYLLLSLVPLLLVGISITASVLQYALGTGAEAERHVFEFLERFVPLERQILRAALDDVIAARGPVAGLGLAGLLLVALGGFSTLETAINMIWRAPPRHFLLNRLFALLMLVVTGALLLLSLSITAVVQWAGRLPALSWLADEWSVQIVGILLPVAISGLMFSAIYRYYPGGRRGWSASLRAGFLAALFWELFKVAYTYYSTTFVDQRATYGTLGGFIGLVLWIYYSSAVVLLGSELTWVLEGCPPKGGPPVPPEAGP